MKILITAPSIYAQRVCSAFADTDFEPESHALIHTDNSHGELALRELMEHQEDFDVAVFCSRSAINAFHKFVIENKISRFSPHSIAIGEDYNYLTSQLSSTIDFSPATASNLQQHESSPMGLVDYLNKQANELSTQHSIAILAPKVESDNEPNTVPHFIQALIASKWNVKRFDVYSTHILPPSNYLLESLEKDEAYYDWIFFTSGVEIQSFLQFASPHVLSQIKTKRIKIACMGKYTANHANKLGFPVSFVAKHPRSFVAVAREMQEQIGKASR